MIKWLKRKQNIEQKQDIDSNCEPAKQGVFGAFKHGLSKTREQFGKGIKDLLVGRLFSGKAQEINAVLEPLEDLLLRADFGVGLTTSILANLRAELHNKVEDGDVIFSKLKKLLEEMLEVNNNGALEVELIDKPPLVILMVGVNGAGKTTSIGKLASIFQKKDKKVMLCAGDTFRAAAIEQLQVWGERNEVPVISQHTGADSASVIYDALFAARARGIDILIADTAGRLHTQANLMEELKKVKRVLQKLDVNAPHEILLVLDASIGQNALNQAREFNKALGVTGIIMTKLDGSAKGGILFAIANELKIPFRYLGLGEKIDDLRPFNAKEFVRAIFNDDKVY